MEIKELKIEMPEVTCEYSLDKTPYKEVRWQRIPPRPNVFITKSKSSFLINDYKLMFGMMIITCRNTACGNLGTRD